MQEDEITHFGYESVTAKEKTNKVKTVFDNVASKYDLMNDLMSFGIHRLWKRSTINLLEAAPHHQVLDLAGGSGDLSALLLPIVKAGKITLADINFSMLDQGRQRMENKGILNQVNYIQANAEKLPFKENHFDRITIAFGLRNVTDQNAALRSMYQVLKPGGRMFILEFSKPLLPLLSKAYDAFSFSALPFLGKIIADDEASYRYLAESIRKHPAQTELQQMCLDAGFDECKVLNFSGGIVALHRAYKY